MANAPYKEAQDPGPSAATARRRVATATIVGSALEWYDFYLYASMAALVFGKIFFPQTDGATGTMAAFATFAAGFLARPLGGILLRKERRGLLVVLAVSLGYNALSYIFKTFSLAYLSDFQDVSASVGAFGITLASAAALVTVPFFGWASDRFGSRRVLAAGGIASALFAFPFFVLLDTGNSILIWLCLVIATGLLAPAMFAPQGSLLSRQFPPDVRVSGVGTGREIGAALSGGLALLAALAIVGASATNATWGVSLLLVAAAVVVVIGAAFDRGSPSASPAVARDSGTGLHPSPAPDRDNVRAGQTH
ncbi:MFS transporter [Streptomyces bacillaris]|uniref:MFS transporter n=1 Tax=Streptomyces bacillaris TaxID=68179 RepID=UPI0034602582